MHLVMILAVFVLAWCLRWRCADLGANGAGSWQQRWQTTLFLFLFPPLLMLTTALAVLCMGPQGQMVGLQAGWSSYIVTLVFLGQAIALNIQLFFEGSRSLQKISTFPQTEFPECLPGQIVSVIDMPAMFAAQIGFWEPRLVVSQKLIETLDKEHLNAVLMHEQAHYIYRDTFWFFWLGWMRQVTCWLPHTDELWQELLVLRELRADSWAAQRVDTLLLAESLLRSASSTTEYSEIFSAAFSRFISRCRLEERIEALLSEPEPVAKTQPWHLAWLLLTCLPFVSLPFHYL